MPCIASHESERISNVSFGLFVLNPCLRYYVCIIVPCSMQQRIVVGPLRRCRKNPHSLSIALFTPGLTSQTQRRLGTEVVRLVLHRRWLCLGTARSPVSVSPDIHPYSVSDLRSKVQKVPYSTLRPSPAHFIRVTTRTSYFVFTLPCQLV